MIYAMKVCLCFSLIFWLCPILLIYFWYMKLWTTHVLTKLYWKNETNLANGLLSTTLGICYYYHFIYHVNTENCYRLELVFRKEYNMVCVHTNVACNQWNNIHSLILSGMEWHMQGNQFEIYHKIKRLSDRNIVLLWDCVCWYRHIGTNYIVSLNDSRWLSAESVDRVSVFRSQILVHSVIFWAKISSS